MKVILSVAFSLFCLFLTSGAQLQCWDCDSTVSYDDCQNKSKVVNCSSVNDHACYQADVKYEKGGVTNLVFDKGCVAKSLCEAYNKGEIGFCISLRNQGYEVDCNAMCCHEDECNMKDLLVDKEDNKGAQLQCWECDSKVSNDDCQNKSTVVNCSSVNDHACFQADIKAGKAGADTEHFFDKGCLNKSLCEAYNKGEIDQCIALKNQGYEVECKAMCCHEDECNMKDLLVDEKENKGAQLQCWECDSKVSYDDCQSKSTVVNCSSVNDHACYQADIKYEKGGVTNLTFAKGCLMKSFCEAYNKGDIGLCNTLKNESYEVDCKAMCCHEDECNMKNLLVDEKDNKGSAFAISVMILLSGLLLTLVNIN